MSDDVISDDFVKVDNTSNDTPRFFVIPDQQNDPPLTTETNISSESASTIPKTISIKDISEDTQISTKPLHDSSPPTVPKADNTSNDTPTFFVIPDQQNDPPLPTETNISPELASTIPKTVSIEDTSEDTQISTKPLHDSSPPTVRKFDSGTEKKKDTKLPSSPPSVPLVDKTSLPPSEKATNHLVPQPTYSSLPRTSSIEDLNDEFYSNLNEFEDETIVERLIGLTEMFPKSLRTCVSVSAAKAVNGVKFSYGLTRQFVWFFASTSAICFLPLLLELERVQVEEQEAVEQRTMMLGPHVMGSGSQSLAGFSANIPNLSPAGH